MDVRIKLYLLAPLIGGVIWYVGSLIITASTYNVPIMTYLIWKHTLVYFAYGYIATSVSNFVVNLIWRR